MCLIIPRTSSKAEDNVSIVPGFGKSLALPRVFCTREIMTSEASSVSCGH